MFEINKKNKDHGCSPVSSNCVIWQGPDLDCINLCKGDSISDVVFKLATEICQLKDELDLNNYELSCLSTVLDGDSNFSDLMNTIIKRICALECNAGITYDRVVYEDWKRNSSNWGYRYNRHSTPDNELPISKSELAVRNFDLENYAGTSRSTTDVCAEAYGFFRINNTSNTGSGYTKELYESKVFTDLGFVPNNDGNVITKFEMPEQYHYTDPKTGDLVKTNDLKGYVSLVGVKAATNLSLLQDLSNDNTNLDTAVKNLETKVLNLETDTELPKLVPTGVFKDQVARTLDVVLKETEKQFSQLQSVTGTPEDINRAIAQLPPDLGSKEMLSKKELYSSIPTWKNTYKSLADAFNNMSIMFTDVLSFAENVKKTLPSGCLDIKWKLRAVTSGTPVSDLAVYLNGSDVPDNFTILDTSSNYIEIKDSKNYVEKYSVDPITILTQPFNVSLDNTGLDVDSVLDVKLQATLTNPDGNVCQQVVTYKVLNFAKPTLTLTPQATSMEVDIVNVKTADKYTVTLIAESGTSYTRDIQNPMLNEKVTFNSLLSNTRYYAKVVTYKDGASIETTSSTVYTLADTCLAPNNVTATFGYTKSLYE